jgi:hypothetical protein
MVITIQGSSVHAGLRSTTHIRVELAGHLGPRAEVEGDLQPPPAVDNQSLDCPALHYMIRRPGGTGRHRQARAGVAGEAMGIILGA